MEANEAMLIGHERIRSFFNGAIANGRLSHAYLFTGPKQVGKRRMAEEIIGKCAKHPDIVTVARETKDIVVEQIQELRTFLSRRPVMGERMAGIIDDAEHLNAAAANALLKTLEEPAGNAIIFLIAEDAAALPETIRSRCQTITFAPVPEEEITAALKDRGITEDRAQELARASRGLPGLAVRWADDPAQYEAYQVEQMRFRELWGKPFYTKRAAVEELFPEKGEKSVWPETLCIWELEVRDTLLGERREDASAILPVAEAIREAKQWLTENVNPHLAIEHILLTIP